MNRAPHAHHHHPPPSGVSPATLGAPPTLTLGPAPAGLVWWGLASAPRGVRWTHSVDAGADGNYRYFRQVGTAGARTFLMVGAMPMQGGPALVFYYVASGPRASSASLGQPPPMLGQPYDGNPDDPYPPSGPGWFETGYEDRGARKEASSLLGQLPVNHYVDRLLPTGLYRIFAFEAASGAKSLGALRYWGEAGSLGQEPSLSPADNANSVPAISAAQTLMTWLSQNGCPPPGTYVQEVADLQTAYNATNLGPAITVDGFYGSNSQAALQLVLNSVSPPAGTAPDCTAPPAIPGPNTPTAPNVPAPSAPLVVPTVNIVGRDLYDTLDPSTQGRFRTALYAQISPSKCPGLDFTTITSADGLIDSGNRAGAVACFQLAHGMAAGPLDQATYSAIMGGGVAQAGVSGGAIAAGVAVLAALGAALAAAAGYNPLSMIRT